MSVAMVKYNTDAGQEMQLDSATVRAYLVNGGGNVSDQEVFMFLQLCAAKHLNPFLREAYLIKFGSSPATIVTGKDYFTRTASQNDSYEGFSAGVIVTRIDEFGNEALTEREGTIVLSSEKLIGGWATVWRKDRRVPVKNSAMLTEYLRYKGDGVTVMANWKSMPATMIRKVALVQSLREAFPEQFGGMYSPDEMPVDATVLPDRPVEVITESTPGLHLAGTPAPAAPTSFSATVHSASPGDQVVNFGKHKGLTIAALYTKDKGYFLWLNETNAKYKPICDAYIGSLVADMPIDYPTVDPMDVPFTAEDLPQREPGQED